MKWELKLNWTYIVFLNYLISFMSQYWHPDRDEIFLFILNFHNYVEKRHGNYIWREHLWVFNYSFLKSIPKIGDFHDMGEAQLLSYQYFLHSVTLYSQKTTINNKGPFYTRDNFTRTFYLKYISPEGQSAGDISSWTF